MFPPLNQCDLSDKKIGVKNILSVKEANSQLQNFDLTKKMCSVRIRKSSKICACANFGAGLRGQRPSTLVRFTSFTWGESSVRCTCVCVCVGGGGSVFGLAGDIKGPKCADVRLHKPTNFRGGHTGTFTLIFDASFLRVKKCLGRCFSCAKSMAALSNMGLKPRVKTQN